MEGYRLSGGVGGALEAAAEEGFSQLEEDEQRAARHLLVRLAVPSPVSGWVRRAVPRANVASEGPKAGALAALVATRLVVVSETRVEIAHDALLLHWPRLRGWLAERALAADLLQQLDQATTTWLTSGRRVADLYRGPRLTAALGWYAQHPEDVSPIEAEFLEAAAGAADAEFQAARAQAARESRGRRRLRTVALVLAAVLVLAIAALVVAAKARSSARSEASRAQQAALGSDARRLAVLSADAPDIATSSLLAVAAYRLQDVPETRGALLGAVERNQSALWRIQLQHRPQYVSASPSSLPDRHHRQPARRPGLRHRDATPGRTVPVPRLPDRRRHPRRARRPRVRACQRRDRRRRPTVAHRRGSWSADCGDPDRSPFRGLTRPDL